MGRNIFGWDLPPGVTTSMLPGNSDAPCMVCGRNADGDGENACICPECPVCQTYGDPDCYENHGLTRSSEQIAGRAALEAKWEAEAKAEAAYLEQWSEE